jgi:FkbM family methyltransferase
MHAIKTFLKKIPILGPLAKQIHSRLWHRLPSELTLTDWIELLIPQEEAQIVQIGSNDGKEGDPIHCLLEKRKKWKALLVEPVPYLFERLKRNYPDHPRFRFENAAINDGTNATFYWVDESARKNLPDLPFWYDQLGSFDRQHIVKHLDGVLEPYIVSTEIRGLSLGDLFLKNRISRISLLHVDAEGHDYKIISQLDLSTTRPDIILFEHSHLADDELQDSIRRFSRRYKIFKFKFDFLCVKKDWKFLFNGKLKRLERQRPSMKPVGGY